MTIWQQFVETFSLNQIAQQRFEAYLKMLIQWNKRFNITRIDEPNQIITYHFFDALQITKVVDYASMHHTIDVGSGGGVPGIPLAIMYPEQRFTLLEVIQKRVVFLQTVAQELGLTNVKVLQVDWRTFIRTCTESDIDCVVARASLAPKELVRMFKPMCSFSRAQLVYWASTAWKPESAEKKYLHADVPYVVGDRQRRYIIFKKL